MLSDGDPGAAVAAAVEAGLCRISLLHSALTLIPAKVTIAGHVRPMCSASP